MRLPLLHRSVPTASKFFANKADGGVESSLASSHLGGASEIFLVGMQACPSEPHGSLWEATVSWLCLSRCGLQAERGMDCRESVGLQMVWTSPECLSPPR